MAELNYDVNPEELENVIEPIPAGTYEAVIEQSDMLPTKAGTGQMLKLVYQVIAGPMKGKKVFEQLNIINPSKQAEEISRRTLNSIGVACGVTKIQDSAQLHNIPLYIEVTVKDSESHGKQNKIKKHLPIKGTPAPTPAQTGTAPDASAPAVDEKMPWIRK